MCRIIPAHQLLLEKVPSVIHQHTYLIVWIARVSRGIIDAYNSKLWRRNPPCSLDDTENSTLVKTFANYAFTHGVDQPLRTIARWDSRILSTSQIVRGDPRAEIENDLHFTTDHVAVHSTRAGHGALSLASRGR